MTSNGCRRSRQLCETVHHACGVRRSAHVTRQTMRIEDEVASVGPPANLTLIPWVGDSWLHRNCLLLTVLMTKIDLAIKVEIAEVPTYGLECAMSTRRSQYRKSGGQR